MVDPNFFQIDWERVLEVLATLIILSFLVERALAVIFESRFWIVHPELEKYRELVTLAACFAICCYLQFDAFLLIVPIHNQTGYVGIIATAVVIAGGSKASVKLFHDILHVYSTSYSQRDKLRAPPAPKPDLESKRGSARIEADRLIELMREAASAMDRAGEAWNFLKIEAERSVYNKRWPDFVGRWRLAEAERAKIELDHLVASLDQLQGRMNSAIGVMNPTVGELQVELRVAEARELKKPT